MIRTEALRVFVTVAECGNIRDAAARLGRTPSAVSMSLAQMEEQLGVALFETDRKHTLSAIGQQIRQTAGALVAEHDAAVDRIRDLASGAAGHLRLAAVPSVAAQLLPAVLTRLLKERPGIGIDLFDTDSTAARAMVLDGQVEIAIAGGPPPEKALSFEPLFQDHFRLVCPEDHPLAARSGALRWRDLTGERVIVNHAMAGSAVMAALAPGAAVSRLSARNVISLLALVRAGAGVTLLPALATLDMGAGLAALPLADPAARRQVGFIARAGRLPGPLCVAFKERLAQAVGRDAPFAAVGLIATAPTG